MKKLSNAIAAGLAAMAVSTPGLAHVASSSLPHVHAGDGWGVLALATLAVVAAWLGRHGR